MRFKVIGQVLSSYLTLGLFPTIELAQLFIEALGENHIYGYIEDMEIVDTAEKF
jgi:hypothetical protein